MMQEQKAKAYDEAIERAKSELNSPDKRLIEYIFPELKESEDERIRQEMIDFLQETIDNVGESPNIWTMANAKKWLAWLEKQGKHTNFRNEIQVRDKVTRNQDGMLVNLSQLNRVAKKNEKQDKTFTKKYVDDAYLKGISDAKHELEKQGKNNMGISEATKKKLEDNLNKALEKETPESWDKFLEKQGKQNPAWSEEDEKMLQNILECLRNGWRKLPTDILKYESWLKSLKDRVQPQQEWSDEDNEHIKSIISTIECSKAQFPNSPAVLEAYNSDLIWLKSFRPHSSYHEGFKKGFAKAKEMHYDHWKPSGEQMRALNTINVTGEISYVGQGQDLINLYNDLKKLKG